MSIVPQPLPLSAANELVVEQMDRLNDNADLLIAGAQNAILGLQSTYINAADLDPRFTFSDGDLGGLLDQLGDIPDPDLTQDWLDKVNIDSAGPEFTFDASILAKLNEALPEYLLPAMPALPAMPTEPSDPGEPAPLPDPTAPTLVLPDAPDTTIDEPSPVFTDYSSAVPFPTLREITLPDAPVLQLSAITFEGVRPEFDFEAPDLAQFQFTPGQYEPLFVQDLKEAILRVLQGGTGVAPEIEEALFERAREREAELGYRERDTVINDFANRAWKQPPGALARRVDRARVDAGTKISQLNRDQYIEGWKLEVEQFRAVMASAIGLEEAWSSIFVTGERLRFEAAQMQLEFALQVFNALVTKINAQAQLYGVEAEVYRARLTAEATKIQIYSAELEARRIIGELNAQDVAIFGARLQALSVNADIYRSRVEGYVAKFKEIDSRISVYHELMETNKTRANIYESDVRALATKTEAQKNRDERFAIKARIFSTKTEAKKVEYEALLEGYNQNFKVAELRRDTFVANGDRIKAMIAAESGRIQALVARYEAIAAQVAAKSDVEKARYGLMLAFAQAQIERMKAAADILLKNGEINIQSALQAQSIMLRARETAATTLAQLAAGMTSAASIQASVSQTFNGNLGYNYSGQLDIY